MAKNKYQPIVINWENRYSRRSLKTCEIAKKHKYRWLSICQIYLNNCSDRCSILTTQGPISIKPTSAYPIFQFHPLISIPRLTHRRVVINEFMPPYCLPWPACWVDLINMTIVALTKLGQYPFQDLTADRSLGQNTDIKLDWQNWFRGLVGGGQRISVTWRNPQFGVFVGVVC